MVSILGTACSNTTTNNVTASDHSKSLRKASVNGNQDTYSYKMGMLLYLSPWTKPHNLLYWVVSFIFDNPGILSWK